MNKIETVNLLPVFAEGLPASVKRRPETMHVSSKTIFSVELGTRYIKTLVTPDNIINLAFPHPQYLSQTK